MRGERDRLAYLRPPRPRRQVRHSARPHCARSRTGKRTAVDRPGSHPFQGRRAQVDGPPDSRCHRLTKAPCRGPPDRKQRLKGEDGLDPRRHSRSIELWAGGMG
jgi:hypothetical protein